MWAVSSRVGFFFHLRLEACQALNKCSKSGVSTLVGICYSSLVSFLSFLSKPKCSGYYVLCYKLFFFFSLVVVGNWAQYFRNLKVVLKPEVTFKFSVDSLGKLRFYNGYPVGK